MPLFQNPDQISPDQINKHDRYITSRSRCIQFEIQAALIPDQNKFEYQSAPELVRTVQGFLNSQSAEEYSVYFHGISDTECEAIKGELRAAGIMRTVRFTFENTLNASILRIRPGPDHHMIAAMFAYEFTKKMASIPGHTEDSVSCFGSTRFWIPGVRSKEGDQGFRPRTRCGREAWPSVMVEIGYSEGMDFLRLDAEWWLINSNDRTRFVILIEMESHPFVLRIECWMIAETGRRQTRQTPGRFPRCVQDFEIDETGAVVSTMGSTELEIPYDAIFDDYDPKSPLPPPPPARFSFLELSRFAVKMFQDLKY